MPDLTPRPAGASRRRPRVLLTDFAWPDAEWERAELARQGIELVLAGATDEASLSAQAADVDTILTCWAPVGAVVLEAAKRCRHVGRLGIGLDNIDVAAATRLGLVVTNVPDYCQHEVADHTLALLLALARQVGLIQLDSKSGRYLRREQPVLHRLNTRTLGIVGLGSIGRHVASQALALGLRVLASAHRRPVSMPGVEVCTLDQLLAESDFVSLHLPLTPLTHHFLDARALARMKPGAFLINTARGGLVDPQALAAELASGRLAGAGLDVQEPEPPPLDQPPWNDPRVIVTPHMAFLSVESLEELRRSAVRQVCQFLAGQRPPHVVNPEVFGTARS